MAVRGLDDYLKQVIQKGDKGSALLREVTLPSLRYSEGIEVIKGSEESFPVLRIPAGHCAVVHSAAGNPIHRLPYAHARTLVDNLVNQARKIGAKPVAFANVVDSRTGDLEVLHEIASSFLFAAKFYQLAIMNGENAIMGARVDMDANVSGTMISTLPIFKANFLLSGPTANRFTEMSGSFTQKGTQYAIFRPNNEAVFINSDGVGTKLEWYERTSLHALGIDDWLAMTLDDSVKKRANVKVAAAVVETNGNIPIELIEEHLKKQARKLEVIPILHHEPVGCRIESHDHNFPVYNIVGSVVSTIDEKALRNPLIPKPEDELIAIRGYSRSNGHTRRRSIISKLGKEWCERSGITDWQETPEGGDMLEYLTKPSLTFYPAFQELARRDLATMLTHMSGGAFNGKLARILRKSGLYVELKDLFEPDKRELVMQQAAGLSNAEAYAQWPMGNEGFVATQYPRNTIEILQKHGLTSRHVGTLKVARDCRTGVYIGSRDVYFSGD